MPSLQLPANTARHSLGHINLMVDSFIANVDPDDLRAITRSLLATSSPTVVSQFKSLAQSRLEQIDASHISTSAILFSQSRHGYALPTRAFEETLRRARCLYGAGMGVASLSLLTEVVRRTIGIRWEENDDLMDALAIVDADITQAIQSCKEEIRNPAKVAEASVVVSQLKMSIAESLDDVRRWGGEFPFDKSIASLEYWKL